MAGRFPVQPKGNSKADDKMSAIQRRMEARRQASKKGNANSKKSEES